MTKGEQSSNLYRVQSRLPEYMNIPEYLLNDGILERKPISRVYHHYTKWEDHAHGMYQITTGDNDIIINDAASLLKDDERLLKAMRHVAFQWKHSAQINMTNRNRNRQAWLGQAACCHEVNAPEELTKKAWGTLTTEERNAANAVADRVIIEWEERYNAETWLRN